MIIGLVSDTHAVWDPELAMLFKDTAEIIHAGDIGHHGGHGGERRACVGTMHHATPSLFTVTVSLILHTQ